MNFKHVLTVIIFVSIFSGCISQPDPSETSIPKTIPTAIPTTTMADDRQVYAITSTSIDWESETENITIYVPVLLDENKSVLKMYDKTIITGNITTAIIDTEHGKALRISKSGLGDYVFNWKEVPGKDTDRFVEWQESRGFMQPGEKLEIRKMDNDRLLSVSGSTSPHYEYLLNEKNILESYNFYDGNKQKMEGGGLFFAKEENGNLNIYTGNNEVNINESHEKLKADEQTFDEFFRRFTIIMSNYESPEHFIQMPISESDPEIEAWVYSDSDLEKFSIHFTIDPKTSLYESGSFSSGIALGIGTQRWIHLRKGWHAVNMSLRKMVWDAVRPGS